MLKSPSLHRLLNSLLVVGWRCGPAVSAFQSSTFQASSTFCRQSPGVALAGRLQPGSVHTFSSHSRQERIMLKDTDRGSYASDSRSESSPTTDFQPGSRVQVEVRGFGPLGASVDVIATSHDAADVIAEDVPALGTGLISQSEIQYFRSGRNNLDVVRGEVLCAYVEQLRDDGKLRIGLRPFGGRAKADELGALILERLEENGGELQIGDKSKPHEINREFPGTSKAAFKKAISALYKQRKVVPGPFVTKAAAS